MSEENVNYRLGCLEDSDKNVVSEVNRLSKEVHTLSKQFEGFPDRVHKLELELVNMKMISKAMTFLGSAVVGSAIMMIMAFIFGEM